MQPNNEQESMDKLEQDLKAIGQQSVEVRDAFKQQLENRLFVAQTQPVVIDLPWYRQRYLYVGALAAVFVFAVLAWQLGGQIAPTGEVIKPQVAEEKVEDSQKDVPMQLAPSGGSRFGITKGAIPLSLPVSSPIELPR